MKEKQDFIFATPYGSFDVQGQSEENQVEMLEEGREWMKEYMLDYDDQQYTTDVEYMKGFYSPMCKDVLGVVQDECDKYEYEGSVMFDEYPDKVTVDKIIDDAYGRISYMENMYKPVMEEDEGVEAMGSCMSCRGQESWLRGLVGAILINEMHHRRRRYYKHRRRYY